MADDGAAAPPPAPADAPAVQPSSSFDDILGQIDSTLAAPEPLAPAPAPACAAQDDDEALNALLEATGLDDGSAAAQMGAGENDNGADFDDIFGSSGRGVTGGQETPAAAAAAAASSTSSNGGGAWKNFGEDRGVMARFVVRLLVASPIDCSIALHDRRHRPMERTGRLIHTHIHIHTTQTRRSAPPS